MKSNYNIAIIDDDRNYLQIISMAFKDFNVTAFNNPGEAIKLIKKSPPDAVILDLHLDNDDGFTVCEEIRKFNLQIPVFFLTNDQNISSIKQGLELGCIDYLSKSSSIEELKMRIVQRLNVITKKPSTRSILKCGCIEMDLEAHLVTVLGEEVPLSPKEYDILRAFLKNPDRLLTKEQLLTELWSGVSVDANNIDTHMFNIRKKIQHSPIKIQTLKSLGYILRSGT